MFQRVPALVVPPPGDIQSRAQAQLAANDFQPIRRFAAARELLAQSGQKPRRRKRRNPTAIPSARLEHLMCFIDNSRLHNDIQTMEEVFCHQASDLLDINYVRGEEVLRLGCEAQTLKQQMQEFDDAVQGCNHQKSSERSAASSRSEDCHAIQQVLDRRREQISDLRRQLESQSAELVRAKEMTLEAQREAAKEDAKLEMLQTMHHQEMQELQSHLSIEEAARNVEQRCEALGLSSGKPAAVRPSHAADPSVQRLQIMSARSLLDTERRLHREEVDALMRDFRATNAVITAAVSSSTVLHGSDFDTCLDHLRQSEGASSLSSGRWRAAGRRDLRRCLEELQRPTNLLLSTLEQPILPKVPAPMSELDVWLKAFSTRLSWASEMV